MLVGSGLRVVVSRMAQGPMLYVFDVVYRVYGHLWALR